MIYKAYDATDRIYTPIQLLEEINKTIKENGKTEQQIINKSKELEQNNKENE